MEFEFRSWKLKFVSGILRLRFSQGQQSSLQEGPISITFCFFEGGYFMAAYVGIETAWKVLQKKNKKWLAKLHTWTITTVNNVSPTAVRAIVDVCK